MCKVIRYFIVEFNNVAIRRIRKIAKSDYELHVRSSVRMDQLGWHWTDFDET